MRVETGRSLLGRIQARRSLFEIMRTRRACPRRGEPLETPDAWVYLLRCSDGSLYTGWTVNLERRLARHRSGAGSRYTASRLPLKLELAIAMADSTAARREEARIKRLPRPAKLALLNSAQTPA
jgi:putative endonuclease